MKVKLIRNKTLARQRMLRWIALGGLALAALRNLPDLTRYLRMERM